jgi:uncharacterized alpha-E superfamily protein
MAENLYWLGRYLERAEDVARLADVEYYAALEAAPRATGAALWEPVLAATGVLDDYRELAGSDPAAAPAPAAFLLLDAANPSSIRSSIARARELARVCREFLPREAWEELNGLYLWLQPVAVLDEPALHELTGRVRSSIWALQSLLEHATPHDEGYQWFRAGLFLERADMLTRFIDAKHGALARDAGEAAEPLAWAAVLRAASAFQAFRRTAGAEVSAPAVVAFLLLDRAFPRSMLFALVQLGGALQQAGTTARLAYLASGRALLAALQLELESVQPQDLATVALHEYMEELQARLAALDDALTASVFRALPGPAA